MSYLENGKIIVTGGAGFIGSALVHALNQRGFENILVADFLGKDEKWKNLVPLRFLDYFEADDLLRQLEERPLSVGTIGTVFHLGACSATTETDAAYLIRNNFEYTKRLAEWASSQGARFIYASSAATYGDGENGMEDDEEKLNRLRPLNAYGYSKHLFDLFAAKRGLLRTLVGLKYFNVFGPNEGHKGEMRSLVHKAYGQILSSGRLRLFRSHRSDFADGEQKRDFLYVKDAVEMTLHFAESTTDGGLYNLGSGNAHTWLALASAIFKAMDRPPEIEFIDIPENIRDKYQYYTCADITKLRGSGFDREVRPLEESVSDYVRNYLIPDRRLGDEA